MDTPPLTFYLNKLKEEKQPLTFGVSIKSGTVQIFVDDICVALF